MSTCPNGAGSINNPNGSDVQTGRNMTALSPYVPYTPNIGDLEISKVNPDSYCETSDQLRQEAYVAEALNISGAPINVYRLLGIHEQGQGTILTSGKLFGSPSTPGFPITNLNTSEPWKSLDTGTNVVLNAAIGLDFGIKILSSGGSEYAPSKNKWTKIGSLSITQSNLPNEFARQVKVEITDGLCQIKTPTFVGSGDGAFAPNGMGPDVSDGTLMISAASATEFAVQFHSNGHTIILQNGLFGTPYFSTIINFTINVGQIPFVNGDTFFVPISYIWKRVGLYNLTQSPLAQTLNLNTVLNVRAVRVIPTLFSGNSNWTVYGFDVSDSPATDINNIQDLFFNENRDRDYALEPVVLKVQYAPADSMTDLSRFGLSILDQYSFNVSFATMINVLGRPIVTGDILEIIPEMQYDHNLKPVRKFMEVTDTGWAAEGFSTMWKPTIYRFSASQATPSQETKDIFGTLDTQKYLVADSVLMDGVSPQLDITPLTQMEEITKEALNAVPERGSNDGVTIAGTHLPPALPPLNQKGTPSPTYGKGKPNIYIEDGLPKGGEPYTEGYALPDTSTATDGEYFRIYYQESLNIAPRLYRFSVLKHKWLFVEQDKRGDYSSHKPSVRNILQSSTKQTLNTK